MLPNKPIETTNFAANILLFIFFNSLPLKTLKMKISTSVWGAQHPNAGQNIQHWTTLDKLDLNGLRYVFTRPT